MLTSLPLILHLLSISSELLILRRCSFVSQPGVCLCAGGAGFALLDPEMFGGKLAWGGEAPVMESSFAWLFCSSRKFRWLQQTCLSQSRRDNFEFLPTDSDCSKVGVVFVQRLNALALCSPSPLLPGFHLLSCYYLVSCCFVSLCGIANMNYKGFVLCFGHNGTHIQISIYSSSSEGCAAEVCVTPPRTSKCKFTHKHLER